VWGKELDGRKLVHVSLALVSWTNSSAFLCSSGTTLESEFETIRAFSEDVIKRQDIQPPYPMATLACRDSINYL
jgi:hypothetical protein